MRASDVVGEYAVSTRTFARDMQKIASVIPLRNDRGKWSIDIQTLNQNSNDLSHTLLCSFADNVQIELSCLDKSNINPTRISFAINYAKLPKILGEQILDAMTQEKQCSFLYVKVTSRSQRVVDPMRLYTQDESWYLIARDHKDEHIKTFLLSKIEQFCILDTPVSFTVAMESEADKIISNIWHSSYESEILVKLYIKAHIAHYIERKKLHTTQVIVDRHHDGGLEIECSITNELEILPAIKSWLPHIHILEPRWLRDKLLDDMESYMQEQGDMDI